MSQTFDAPREQQASCERREPGALATVLALPARATAAVAWEPWLGEATIARDYGVCTSDALARPPLAIRCGRVGVARGHARIPAWVGVGSNRSFTGRRCAFMDSTRPGRHCAWLALARPHVTIGRSSVAACQPKRRRAARRSEARSWSPPCAWPRPRYGLSVRARVAQPADRDPARRQARGLVDLSETSRWSSRAPPPVRATAHTRGRARGWREWSAPLCTRSSSRRCERASHPRGSRPEWITPVF